VDGVRVVELGVWVAAPAAGGILADWGADVIKIEPPAGDPGGLVDVPDGQGTTTMLATSVDVALHATGPRVRVPDLGQHTDVILAELDRTEATTRP